MNGGGVCRKRVGNEEIFGSSTSPTACWQNSSNKRSKFVHPGLGFGSDDKVFCLSQLFPGFSHELLESVLKAHDYNVEDAIGKLNSLSNGDVQIGNDSHKQEDSEGLQSCAEGSTSQCTQEENIKTESAVANAVDASKWADEFVREMMGANNIDDARGRAGRLLDMFEKNVISLSGASKEELELDSLKDHLQKLLRDNHILKRAVNIQNERNLEHEENVRQVQQIKNLISQYEEQMRSLELNNYTLQFHLQRAQESSSTPGHFHGHMP